jgi:hypothetical protein
MGVHSWFWVPLVSAKLPQAAILRESTQAAANLRKENPFRGGRH